MDDFITITVRKKKRGSFLRKDENDCMDYNVELDL